MKFVKKLSYDTSRRQICPVSGGKDSSALAIFLSKHIPNLEFVFSDTGAELREVYEYLDKLEVVLGRRIERLNSGKSFDHFLDKKKGFLPSFRARWCTVEMKIKPFEKYVGQDPVEMYIGIRADENRKGYASRSKKQDIKPRLPFVEMDMGLEDINSILDKCGLGKPEYYSWRTRSGCYFCFFQRKIEWVGLLEKHPDLFAKAQRYETEGTYKDGRPRKFTWIKDCTLEELKADAANIKKRYYKREANRKAKELQLDFDGLPTSCVTCHT